MQRSYSAGPVPKLLAASAVAASITGTLTETALATIPIPAGVLGLNGGIEIRSVWSTTNSANSKTMRTRLGGIGGSQFMTLAVTTSATTSDERRIRNRNSASSQIGSAPAGTTGYLANTANTLPTGAVNTAAAVDLVLSAQLANTGETITLESYEVWLLP